MYVRTSLIFRSKERTENKPVESDESLNFAPYPMRREQPVDPDKASQLKQLLRCQVKLLKQRRTCRQECGYMNMSSEHGQRVIGFGRIHIGYSVIPAFILIIFNPVNMNDRLRMRLLII